MPTALSKLPVGPPSGFPVDPTKRPCQSIAWAPASWQRHGSQQLTRGVSAATRLSISSGGALVRNSSVGPRVRYRRSIAPTAWRSRAPQLRPHLLILRECMFTNHCLPDDRQLQIERGSMNTADPTTSFDCRRNKLIWNLIQSFALLRLARQLELGVAVVLCPY